MNFNLPDHLSYEAAMALYDLICDLQAAIWEKYEHHLFPLTVNPLAQEPHLDDSDDSTFDTLQDLDNPPF
jgi:hypothetical protein